MYVWNETVASRGSVEIGSCLLKYLETYVFPLPKQPAKLKIFADNCGGQNKNVTLVMLLLRLVHAGHFQRIELCYLVSGHSYMACDRAFGVIERELRNNEIITSIPVYMFLIANSRKTNKGRYPLYSMKREDFLNFSTLAKFAVKRFAGGRAFSSAAVIGVTSEYNVGYFVKENYDVPDQEATRVSLARQGHALDLSSVQIPPMYEHARKIDRDKLQDLKDLSQYIGTVEGMWVRDIIQTQKELYDVQLKEPPTQEQLEVPDDPHSDQIYDYESVRRQDPSAPGPSGGQ